MQTFASNKDFWENPEIIKYFEEKGADPRVMNKLKNLKNKKNLNVLDLGCGVGRNTVALCQKGFQVYGIDSSRKLVSLTRKKLTKVFPDYPAQARIVVAKMNKIPFPDSTFDVVIATGMLHQSLDMVEYKETIQELARVSKKKGLLYANLFTSTVVNTGFKESSENEALFTTKEGVQMTLISKEQLFEMLGKHRFFPEEWSEEFKEENTGLRAIFRGWFRLMRV